MLVFAFLLTTAAPAASCLDASPERDTPVTLTGRLEHHVYPGEPGYESIRRGDRPEPTYALVLDRSICMNVETGLGAPRAPFRRVQLYTNRGALWSRLRTAVGHRVRISGNGFPAHTGHHHEPLVVEINSLQIRR